MEQLEIARLAELRTSSNENGMMDLDMYINLMTVHRSVMIWADQLVDHDEEADYDEVYKDRDEAEDLYNDYIALARETMKSKNPETLKEYLGLLRKEAEEKFAADKNPVYAPQAERMEMSSEQIAGIIQKREALAKTKCVTAAQRVATALEKNAGGEGK